MTTKPVIVLNAAREVSEALDRAMQANRRPETWAEREQRLADGHSSPTGWPIKRTIKIVDDGLTIPERVALRVVPYEVSRSRMSRFVAAVMLNMRSY